MNYYINLIKNLESPPHKHNSYEIIIFTNGTGTFYTEEKSIPVHPGKIIIIPPGVVHSCTKGDADFERIYINGEFEQVFSLTSLAVISDTPSGDGLFLANLIYKNRLADREYVASLINAFTHFLLQNIKMENRIFTATRDIIEKISNRFYDCDFDLHALLKESGYAEDYIRAKFKKVTKKTPTEFLTEIRINHACYLISTYKNAFPLSDVAERCGYTDYVYFSRRFKQVTGMSPQQYMKYN